MTEKSEYRDNPIISKSPSDEVKPPGPAVIKVTPDMITVLDKRPTLEKVDPVEVQSFVDSLRRLEDLGYRED